MDRTPVKIRGKRGQEKRTPSIPWSRSTSVTSVGSATSRDSKQSKSSPSKPRKRRKVKHALSRLEQLPPELLEKVFFYAANISLPRSSPAIGAKLGHYVQLDFAFRVLYEPELWFGSDAPRVQSELLTCRFFDWKFFERLASRAFCMHQKATKRNYLCNASIGKESYIAEELLHNAATHPFESRKEPPSQQLLPNLVHEIHPADSSPDSTNAPSTPRPCRIPEKLLHAPWTEDKVLLLGCLLRCHAAIDYDLSTAGEVAQQGLSDALCSGHHDAAMLLIHTLPVRLVTTELVRIAVDETGCNREFVEGLLAAASGHSQSPNGIRTTREEAAPFDPHDPFLWAWADRAQRRGDDNGAWLKGKLRQWATEN